MTSVAEGRSAATVGIVGLGVDAGDAPCAAVIGSGTANAREQVSEWPAAQRGLSFVTQVIVYTTKNIFYNRIVNRSTSNSTSIIFLNSKILSIRSPKEGLYRVSFKMIRL